MENLAKAIIAVMKSVKGMEKKSKVGTGNASYNGTRDMDVKEIFNDALADNGLCILPIGIDEETKVSRWEETNQYGTKQKQSVFTKVTTKYLLLHESGESTELSGYGHGVDAQDKSAGKATTYALKNCLLYTFLTPVGKIDDTDREHSDDISVPVVQNKATPKPTPPPAKDEPELAIDNKIKNIGALIKAKSKGKEAAQLFFKYTGAASASEVNKTYDELVEIETKVMTELGY